jgi:hypothetical protein
VTVDLLEGHLTGEFDTEEYHSCDPEEQDVPACLEDRVGVEVGEFGSLLRGSASGQTEVEWIEAHRDTFSGQPRIEKGHRPDENQVSRTSSSCSKVYLRPAADASALASASSRVRATTQLASSAVCNVSAK